jgi:hypothetical protein
VSLLVLLLLSDVEANMLLDRLLELGMVSIDGTVMNSGDDCGKGTVNPGFSGLHFSIPPTIMINSTRRSSSSSSRMLGWSQSAVRGFGWS